MNSNKMFYFEKWGKLVLTWLSFSMCATSRGKRWARAESFSVLTCLTMERSNTSPSYAMGKTEVSLTDVLHSADITAASRRLLDVRKFASWMSWRSTWRSMLWSAEPRLHLTGPWMHCNDECIAQKCEKEIYGGCASFSERISLI